MAKLVKIAETKDVKPGQGIAFDVEGNRIAVFNKEGTFYAMDDTCPHAGASFADGPLDGEVVTCPWHGAEFDITTGEVLGPPAAEGVKKYNIKVEGTEIKVEV